MTGKFIYVYDIKTVQEFLDLGYTLLRDGRYDGLYVFANSDSKKFDEVKGDFTLTDVLVF